MEARTSGTSGARPFRGGSTQITWGRTPSWASWNAACPASPLDQGALAGLPELCATLSMGSGIVDTRIAVCDYANGRTYELEDRMNYDYTLRFDPDSALLYVDRTPYEGREPDQSGLLMLEDSVLTYENQSPN